MLSPTEVNYVDAPSKCTHKDTLNVTLKVHFCKKKKKENDNSQVQSFIST